MRSAINTPRVLFVSDRYEPNNHGGAEKIAQIEAETWAAQGGAAAVLALHGDGVDPEWGDQDSAGVTRFREAALPGERMAGALRTYARTLMSPRSHRALIRAVREFKPDVVHAHHISSTSYGAVAALNRPKVLTFHDYHFACARGGLYRPDHGICRSTCGTCLPYRYAVSPLLNRFDALVAISGFIEKRLHEAGLGHKVVRIPNALPSPAWLPPRVLQRDGLEVMVVGRLERNKAIADFVREFAAAELPGVTLTVIGEGHEEAQIRATAAGSSSVAALGGLDNSEVVRRMRGSDLVVVPSRWHEVLNTVIKEAHALGVPVIATEVGGNSDLIADDVDGYLVPLVDNEPDWPAMMRIIRALASNPHELARLRKNVLTREPFALTEHMKRLTELYETLVTRGKTLPTW